MSLIKAKQIKKLIGIKLITESFVSGTNTTLNINSVIEDKLNEFGFENIASVDINSPGVIESNVCRVLDPDNFTSFFNNQGEEIFAFLNKDISDNWILSFKSLSHVNNTLEDYSFITTTSIILEFNYRSPFGKLPNDFNTKTMYSNQPKKKIISITNQSTISIPYNKKYFGQIPIIQFFDSNLELQQPGVKLNSLTNPTTIIVDFYENTTGILVVM